MKYKALSFYQPYAWMIVNGFIDIDDRHSNFSHRGELLIHASKTVHPQYYFFVKHILEIDIPPLEDLERGGIVGIATLTDCLPPGAPSDVPFERRAHGGQDCYGLVLKNNKPCRFIPMKGKQGLFEVDLSPSGLIFEKTASQSSLF